RCGRAAWASCAPFIGSDQTVEHGSPALRHDRRSKDGDANVRSVAVRGTQASSTCLVLRFPLF
ncbi:MAG: hypothetical protein AAFR19_18655, partial [Pseudomonadota bacterium]